MTTTKKGSGSETRESNANGDLLVLGIYTVREAARLTRVPIASIRRWTLGYTFARDGKRHWSPALVKPQLHPIDSVPAVSFLDLQELRMLHAFRSRGASWQALRVAHERAKERIGHQHPFATGRFWSAGREILAEVAHAERDRALENIVTRQLVFRKFIASYLRGLEFNEHVAIRWYPRRDRRVILDPTRSFGKPVVKEGVPTRVLARSYRAERSADRVAKWYDVDVSSVRAAVEFERRLAA
jgi:uncharacterized protein (DUF433 family)